MVRRVAVGGQKDRVGRRHSGGVKRARKTRFAKGFISVPPAVVANQPATATAGMAAAVVVVPAVVRRRGGGEGWNGWRVRR
ncbi:hypothetical protein Tco_1363752, partial [Tanacetum coccineum]